MMKHLRAAFPVVLLSMLVAPAFAIDVAGELVDLSCYNKDKAKNVGPAHQECAMTCAKKGMTVALVTDSGEVYAVGGDLAKDNNARLVRFMSQKVAVQGSLVVGNDGTKTILGVSLKRMSK